MIGFTIMGSFTVNDVRVLPLFWETIPPEFFEKLAASMPRRVETVIQAKGGTRNTSSLD
jgi:hypothetical protein